MLGEIEINQIKKVFKDNIESNFIAGGNLLVMKDGKEIFYHEAGFADKLTGAKIKRDSFFKLYSMTKPVTAAAVMILLERGLIDLYEPVSKFLPGFRDQMVDTNGTLVPVERAVTLKDLLSMTSGIVYGGNGIAGKDTENLLKELDERLFSNSPMSTIDAMNKLGKCALAFQPGFVWEYGLSADVLGAVIEVVSNKSFGQFLKDEIFEPLEMLETDFWLPKDKRNRLVKTYEADENGKLNEYTTNHLAINHKMDRKPAFESGGAGLVSTIDDYAKFATMLINNGSLNGTQILRPKTVKYLTSATLTTSQQKGLNLWSTFCGFSYGNLMRVMTDCTKAGDFAPLGEYGWDGWLGSYLCNCPSDNLTILFMMQKTDAGTNSVTRKLRNIILSSCCN